MQSMLRMRLAHITLPVLLTASAVAQTASSPAAATSATEQTYRLPTFEVRSAKDFGYRATNSMTATGFGTEIYATPISVSVVTKDFISDAGANYLIDSLRYTAGIVGDARDPNQFTGRGFRTPIQINRLAGFVRSPNTDFVERVDVVKGPNSVFFGRVSPGGLINLTTLAPKQRDETVLKLNYGSYDFKKGVVDVNKVLGDTFSFRLALSGTDRSDGFSDYSYYREAAGYAAFDWHPSRQLNISGNFTVSKNKQNVVSSGSRTNPRYVANGDSSISIQQWAAIPGNVTPNSAYIVAIDEDGMFPNGIRGNNNGPESYKKDDLKAGQVEIIYAPADWLSIRTNVASSEVIDDNVVISGFPRPNGVIADQRPNRYADGSPVEDRFLQSEAAFTFGLAGTKHRLLVGGRYYDRKVRSYFTSGGLTTQNWFTMPPRLIVTNFGTRTVAGQTAGFDIVPADYLYTETVDKAYYAVDQVELIGGRLKLLAGARNAAITNKKTATNVNERTQRQTTPQFGLWFEIVKDVALFANTSKTFEPQYNIDAFGELSDNIQGKGNEFGLKTSFRDNLLSATFSIYEVERSGEVRRDFLREQSTNVIPLFLPGGDERSRGVELDLVYTPSRNYQVTFGWSHIGEAKRIKDVAAPWLVGRRLVLAPKDYVTLWNRYTFVSGALKGAYVGGGVRYSTSWETFLSTEIDIDSPGYTVVDAVVGWEFRLAGRPVKYQLNLKNLTNEKYYDGRWVVADPFTAYLSAEFRF